MKTTFASLIFLVRQRCRFLFLAFFLLLTNSSVFAQAPLVSMQNGKLQYNKYANRGQVNAVNQIPDFSNSGYKGGGVKIPDLPVAETITAIDGDCRKLIQDAIDRVSSLSPDANGYRGTVLLKAGIYPVEGSLLIRVSGVVLRGEGNLVNGTVLIATQQTQHNFIVVQGSGSGYGEVAGSKVRITTTFVPTGAKEFDVAAGHSFVPGDKVVVQKTPNETWIDVIDMRQYGWTASAYKTTYERQVVAVDGNRITLDIPVMDPIQSEYGGGEVFKSSIAGRISHSGVEDIRIESFFASGNDESHGWNAIVFNRVENGWVRRVVAKYFGYACVNLSNMSRFITVEDCAMIDPVSVTTGGRKYSFNLEGNSTNNLFQRCMTWGGRHDYVSGSKVPGPNVFLDCIADNTFADIGPHHRYSTGQLYDNVYGGQIRVQNRGASGTGHGWAGAQTLFWNCHSFKSDIEVESPPTAMNWGIGCVGLKQTNSGYWESWGTPVLPRSLYLQQLQERLGTAAVEETTTADQRNNVLRQKLLERASFIAAEMKVMYGTTPVGDIAAFDLTDNGGILTSQFVSNRPNENFPNIIDNDIHTKYYQNGKKALWVQYKSAVSAIVTRYTIISANDVEERDPLNWYLAGSNNGVNWTTLDTRTGEDFPTRLLTRTFQVNNTQPFVYYRLNITSNGNNNNTQFAEWELFQRKKQQISFGNPGELTFGDEPLELVVSAGSGLPVLLSIVSGPGVLENENYLRITGAGTIVVRATQAGDENYFPITEEYSIVIQKAEQVLDFPLMSPIKKTETVELKALASSGLPVEFTVHSGPGILNGNILSFTGEGQVVIKASQPGNDNYLPAEPLTQSIIVYGDDEKKDDILLVVYPNPTQGKFKIKLEDVKNNNYQFTLFDASGNIIQTEVIKRGVKMFELSFDLEDRIPGIYFLYVTDGIRTWVKQIIKR